MDAGLRNGISSEELAKRDETLRPKIQTDLYLARLKLNRLIHTQAIDPDDGQ